MAEKNDDKLVRAVSESAGEVIREALAERDARLDYLERQLAVDQRYRLIVDSPLWRYAIEAMATGEESAYEIASDLGCTIPELEWAVSRWKASWRR